MGHCKIHDVRWINKEESTDECYRCVFIQRNLLRYVCEDAELILISLKDLDELTGKVIANPKLRRRLALSIEQYKEEVRNEKE